MIRSVSVSDSRSLLGGKRAAAAQVQTEAAARRDVDLAAVVARRTRGRGKSVAL